MRCSSSIDCCARSLTLRLQHQVYADAAQVPADCKQWVQVATGLHDSPMTQTEKDAMTTWVAARRAAIAR